MPSMEVVSLIIILIVTPNLLRRPLSMMIDFSTKLLNVNEEW